MTAFYLMADRLEWGLGLVRFYIVCFRLLFVINRRSPAIRLVNLS